MHTNRLYEYDYDILEIISDYKKFRKYLLPIPEPHHFYVQKDMKITTTCKHLHHILFYNHYQKNELLGLHSKKLFDNKSIIKKAFRKLNNIESSGNWCKELRLKRKDDSLFWVLMSFRLEAHPILQEKQLLCQFININSIKEEKNLGSMLIIMGKFTKE